MFDTHIHVHQYKKGLYDQLQSWQEAGITGIIAVSDDLRSSYDTLEIHAKMPDFVHPCIGFHPESPLPTASEVLEWEKLLKSERDRIVAIGEIGLPYYERNRLTHTEEEAYEQLDFYLQIAKTYDLPVALHAVHEHAEVVYQLLQKRNIKKAHFHWLKADLKTVRRITEAGYYISVTPEVCTRKRDQQLAVNIPLPQLLIETDGPWQYTEKLTTPLLLYDILQSLSALKEIDEQKLQKQLYLNSKQCYELK